MDKEYLGKSRIGVMCGGLVVKLLLGYGFGEIIILRGERCPFKDVDETWSDERVRTSSLPGFISEIKSVLRGVDLIIGCCEQRRMAKAAEELGIPYITSGIVSTVLPDGIPFDRLNLVRIEDPDHMSNPSSKLMVQALQAYEAVKLLTGEGVPVFVPEGSEIDIQTGVVEKVSLEL